MASSKVYRIPYDPKHIEPMLKEATSQAHPVFYISILLMIFILIMAVHFRGNITSIALLLVGIPVYAAVGLYVANIMREYSRRKIPGDDREFIISRDKVIFHQPTYNPGRVRKVVISRSHIRKIEFSLLGKRKVSDIEFQLKDGSREVFLAEMLDQRKGNLLQILDELEYPS